MRQYLHKKFWTGFRNSLFYMVFGTFINIVMTLLCAYPLSRKEFTARNKVAMFFVFTMYFSGGMVPSFMLVNALGLVDTIWAMLIPGAMLRSHLHVFLKANLFALIQSDQFVLLFHCQNLLSQYLFCTMVLQDGTPIRMQFCTYRRQIIYSHYRSSFVRSLL